MTKKHNTKEVLTSKKIIITFAAILTFVVLIITIVYLIVYIKNNDTKVELVNKGKNNTRPTLVTKNNIDQVITSMDEPVADGAYEVVMNTKWTFDNKKSNAYVENSTSNTRTVYFDVFLADSNQLVYSSPYIPVGENLSGFALDSTLSPGNYNAYVTYHLVDDNQEEVSNLSVNVTFQVK